MKNSSTIVAVLIATTLVVGMYVFAPNQEPDSNDVRTELAPSVVSVAANETITPTSDRIETAPSVINVTTNETITSTSDKSSDVENGAFQIRPLPDFSETEMPSKMDEGATGLGKAERNVVQVHNSSPLESGVNDFTGMFANAYRSINEPLEVVDPPPSDNEFPTDHGLDEAPPVPLDMRGERTALLSPAANEFPVVQDKTESSEVSQPTKMEGELVPDAIHQAADIGQSDDTLWWKQLVTQPLNPDNNFQSTDTNSLIYSALKNSPRIQAISKDPLIRELQVMEARSDFDPVSFVRGQWDDRNDPVGNTLTTGNGSTRLEDHIISAVAGMRKKMPAGGDIELGQTIGFQNSNSRFFVPQDQGTATLALNFTQPLMRGRGRFFNESQILIAQASSGVTWEIFKAELQTELEAVAESYWQLYFDRSVYLQKKRNVARGETILEMLEGRRNLDSLPSQIVRARSAVLSRRTELVSAFSDVRNAQTEVRRLIADPDWMASQSIELLPSEPAIQSDYDLPLKQVVQTAIDFRPEIKESLQRAKIAAIQYDVSTNQLLPELSFLFGTYLAALDGDSGIERAFQSQFSGTTPGYSVGFEFEFPIYNRAARSRVAQQSVQRSKIRYEVSEVMQNIIAEAQFAHRRLTTAYQTMNAAKVAIEAAAADLDQNYQRWKSFALVEGDIADGQTPTTVLDQLLDSQDRLTIAELVYSQAELELKVAEVGIRRVMGTLLVHDQVVFERALEDHAPSLIIGTRNSQPEYMEESYDLQPLQDTDMLSPEQLEQFRQQPTGPADQHSPPAASGSSSAASQDFQSSHAGAGVQSYPLR